MSTRAVCALALLCAGACGDNVHLGGGDLLISPRIGLRTNETGAAATFTVSLTNEQVHDVTVTVTSLDLAEGTVSPGELHFTPVTYDTPQLVTVRGVDDDRADGNQTYTVRLDAGKLDLVDLAIVNDDDDTAGFVVSPEIGLSTSEAGAQASFTVRLLSQPDADVVVPMHTSDASEGIADKTELIFTTASWNVDQTVTVTGQPDNMADGNVPYSIELAPALSNDPIYKGLDPDDVLLTNLDASTTQAGILVTGAASPLMTTEAGGTASFSVTLKSQPTANVTIPMSSSDTTEGTVSPTSLVFTPSDWNQPHGVTVTGVDDTLMDGDIAYTVVLGAATSADPSYAGLNAPDLAAVNADNDRPSIAVAPTTLWVSEFADTDSFAIVLTTQPSGNVTVALSSSDTTEGTVSPSSVTFTPGNWNVPQPVTVTGVNDAVADGNQTFSIITGAATSTDAAYNGTNPPDVTVTNVDNDTAQVYVKANEPLIVSENGTTATFQVRLTLAPSGSVKCTLHSSDLTEGTVSPTTLNFSPGNFGFATVTVKGVDDTIVDGDIAFTIILDACTSNDPTYNGVDPRDVAAINLDND